jgi:hypothetical protein
MRINITELLSDEDERIMAEADISKEQPQLLVCSEASIMIKMEVQ